MQERLFRTQSQIDSIHSAANHPIIPERKDLRLTGDVAIDRRREEFVALSSYPILPAFIHAAQLLGQEYHDVDLSRTAPWNVDPENPSKNKLLPDGSPAPINLLLTWGSESASSEEGTVDSWNQVECGVSRDFRGNIRGIYINQRGVGKTDTTVVLEDVLDMAVQNSDRVQQVHQGEPFDFYDKYHHGRDVIEFRPKDQLHLEVLTEEEEKAQEEAHKRINEEIGRIPPIKIFEGAMNPGPHQELAKKAWEEILEDNNRVVKKLHEAYTRERRRRTSQQ